MDGVHISTRHGDHPGNIAACLKANIPLILSEKPISDDLAEAESLWPIVEATWPEQLVFIVDAYRLLPPLAWLQEEAGHLMGRFEQMRASLLEDRGISPVEEAVHAGGMGGFLHHLVSLLAHFVDLENLRVAEAAWARHPSCPDGVPDTYRYLHLVDRRTGQTRLQGEVGKYAYRSKVTELIGTEGIAR